MSLIERRVPGVVPDSRVVGHLWNLSADGQGLCLLGGDPDLYSRKVLAFRVSNPFATDFCIEAFEEALGLNR